MGWLIACEHGGSGGVRRSFSNGTLAGRRDALLSHGSLVVEVELHKGVLRPVQLIRYDRMAGWDRQFTLYLNADGSVSVDHRQAQARAYVRVSRASRRPGRMRITYSWDGPERLGLLTLECVETGAISQAVQKDPLPMQMRDAEALATGAPQSRIDPVVVSVALADIWQRIGPAPTIAAGASVMTPKGYRRIESLRLGDGVTTQSGEVLPLRWIVTQYRPGLGFSTPVRLRSPYFGLNRDLTLAALHQVQAAGPDTAHILGRDRAMIEAGRIQGHPGAELDTSRAIIPYHQLLFDEHAVIDVDGLWTESLFIGALRRSPEIVGASHLAEIGADALPVHRRTASPRLMDFESRSMLDALIA